MAPNNALASKDKTSPKKEAFKTSTTTVLTAGTVEDRGTGTLSGAQIATEIQSFLQGEGKLSLRAETRAFFTVWTFITRLPAPTWTDHHPGFLMRGMAYFPLAGSLVGLGVGVWFDIADMIGLPLSFSAVLSMAASLWVTGCFHEDGLADSADGIGGGWSRQQILTIMTDTRLGTYGCAVLSLYMVAKLHLLTALGTTVWALGDARGAAPALLVSHAVARCTAPYLIRTRDYVDETGPKWKFYTFMVQAKHLVSWNRVFFAVFTSVGLSTSLYGPVVTIVLMASVWLFAHFMGGYAEDLLGGVMGDFLGATICLSEIVCLSVIYVGITLGWTALSLQDASSRMQEWWSSSALRSNEELLEYHWHAAMVILRFVLVILATALWSRNVGHPSVFVRKTVAKNQDADALVEEDAQVRIGLAESATAASSSSKATPLSPARIAVQQVLSNTKSSFAERYEAARTYLDALAKPAGSLGTLEEWAARVAALQSMQQQPSSSSSSSDAIKVTVDPAVCLIFAGDHGAALPVEDGGAACSSFPQAVTSSILQGLQRGIAGASVLSRQNEVALLRVLDVGVAGPTVYDGPVVYSAPKKLKEGTRNLCLEAAMSMTQVEDCLQAGRQAVVDAIEETKTTGGGGGGVFILGEVGIGNTTPSSALAVLLTGARVADVCGAGATLTRTADPARVQHKIRVVQKATKTHSRVSAKRPKEALAAVGGAELAAMVGAFLECADRHIPVLCDGFIVTVAALVAILMNPPGISRILLLSSASAEPGHVAVVRKIQQVANEQSAAGVVVLPPPALSMGLRLGEASAGLLALPLLRAAVAIWNDMGTIQEILEG